MNQDLHKFNLSKTNSGVFVEPFYTRVNLSAFNYCENHNDIEIEIPEFILKKELNESYPQLFTKKFLAKDDWMEVLNDNSIADMWDAYDEVKHDLQEKAFILNTAWEPRIWDEETAYLCHLLPFKLITENEDYELLSLSGCGMDLSYKLEAYMLLVDGSYDEYGYFAKDGIAYFEKMYGEKSLVVGAIKEMLLNKAV